MKTEVNSVQKKILVVDDEKSIVDILKFNLARDGYDVIEAYDGREGLRKALEENPDLILLDVMLPETDGFEVCKKIREKKQTPIIMITARDEEIDKVLGLELGADDYLTKPFGVRELMARIKANLRRTLDANNENSSSKRVFNEITIDYEKYEVTKGSKPVELTIREFELLSFLSKQPNKVFTRETLLEKVWGYEYLGDDLRTVDVNIRRLREKLETNPAEPEYIITKRGVGYFFRV